MYAVDTSPVLVLPTSMNLHRQPTVPPSPEEITQFREKWGMTQGALAAALGIKSGVTTISAWENGRATPPTYLRLALAELAREIERQRARMEKMTDPAEIEADMQDELRRLQQLLGED